MRPRKAQPLTSSPTGPVTSSNLEELQRIYWTFSETHPVITQGSTHHPEAKKSMCNLLSNVLSNVDRYS
jgi:hypothetical protein